MIKTQSFEIPVSPINRFEAAEFFVALSTADYQVLSHGIARILNTQLGIQHVSPTNAALLQKPEWSARPVSIDFTESIASDVVITNRAAACIEFRRSKFPDKYRCHIVIVFDDFLRVPDEMPGLIAAVSDALGRLGLSTGDCAEITEQRGNFESLDQLPEMHVPAAPTQAQLAAAKTLSVKAVREELRRVKSRRSGVDSASLQQTRTLLAAGLIDIDSSGTATATEFGRQLVDKSRWMYPLAVSTLLNAGLPIEAIRVPAATGADETDFAFYVDGLVICELKDDQFQQGHATSFAGRVIQLRGVDEALVISTAPARDEAQQILRELVGHRMWNRTSASFVCGEDAVTEQLRRKVRKRQISAAARLFTPSGPAAGLDFEYFLDMKFLFEDVLSTRSPEELREIVQQARSAKLAPRDL